MARQARLWVRGDRQLLPPVAMSRFCSRRPYYSHLEPFSSRVFYLGMLTHSPQQAPGTFGYDYSKYKPGQMGGESIPMDEFGAHRAQDADALAEQAALEDAAAADADPSDPQSPSKREKALPPIATNGGGRGGVQSPPSPAPFASYKPREEDLVMRTDQIPMPRPEQQLPVQEEESGGCCKCVVM